MPSDKCNLIMAIATGLSLFNVASSRDLLFCQLQQLQCLRHGSTKAYLCFLFCSISFSATVRVIICGTHVMASVRDLDKRNASRGTSYAVLCLQHYSKTSK